MFDHCNLQVVSPIGFFRIANHPAHRATRLSEFPAAFHPADSAS